VRGTIQNPGGFLKSDMLARVELHIEPVQGYTVIPRNAVVTTNGKFYVFVRKPAEHESKPSIQSMSGPMGNTFQRRQ